MSGSSFAVPEPQPFNTSATPSTPGWSLADGSNPSQHRPSNSSSSALTGGRDPSSSGAGGGGSVGDRDKKRKIHPSSSSTGERIKERTVSVDPVTEEESGSPSAAGKPSNTRETKRTRVHFSCVECHRRKQKCDRKEPCSQCVARRVPNLCRPFLNGVEDPNANNDVHARLSAIEGMLARLVTSIPTLTSARPLLAPDSSSPDVSSLATSGEDVFHPQSVPAPAEPPRQIYAHKPPPSGMFPASISPSNPPGRSGFGWGVREGRLISLSIEDNPDLRDILQVLRESGISKHHLEWLISGVPGRRIADGLVQMYFKDIDWTRYKMNRPSFERKYAAFFDSIARNPSSPKIDADTLKWLPLMFIVLAIAALSAPTDIIVADEQIAWSRRFYGSARSGLEYAKALQRDNLDVLFAGLLASRYMLLTRRPAEGSTPLTTAFQLGLYRDGTVLNLTDKREIEIRRRAWAQLYHLDRTISLLVGRPASISDAHTDTKPPANLDDEEIETGDFDPAGHPLSVPTVYTYVIVRHRLAEIMGRIAYHTFAIQLPDYATVLNLDKELLAFRDNLPSFLSMVMPDRSFDSTHPYIFVQRHLLACEWYYTRITLNRPYLLRRKPQDGRYAYSRNAAIESAKADLLARRSFMLEKGDLVINSGGYRVLNSYMVLGVTIKLDPDSPQADELRQLLNVVSGRARDEQGRLSEPIVKEELAIVEFLTAKGSSSRSSQANDHSQNGSSRPGDTDENTPADLLLGLAKTNSGRRAAEEEKRQLRLQQRREMEEQRIAARARLINGAGPTQGNTISSSPWGYVAPSMPGLDVHQPFGNAPQGMVAMQNASQIRKEPRPLQPPSSSKRGSKASNEMWKSPETTFSHFPADPPSPSNSSYPNPAGDVGHGGVGVGGGLISMNNQQLHAPQEFDHQGQQIHVMRQPFSSIDPFRSTTSPDNPMSGMGHMGSVVGPQDSSALFAADEQQQQQHLHSMQQQHQHQQQLEGVTGLQQFGQPGVGVDNFDFTAFSSGVRESMDQMGFNPFAIAQTAEEEAGSEPTPDDETAFLNYILTKFANSQSEAQ